MAARRAYGLSANPVDQVEKLRERPSADIEVFSPEEVRALVRGAASAQDAAIDVDFASSVIRVRASYSDGECTAPRAARSARCPWRPTSPARSLV